jgi:hypothetical protein
VPTILNLSRAGKPLEVTNPYQPVEKQFTLTIHMGRGGHRFPFNGARDGGRAVEVSVVSKRRNRRHDNTAVRRRPASSSPQFFKQTGAHLFTAPQ